jgi:hypothetical protein
LPATRSLQLPAIRISHCTAGPARQWPRSRSANDQRSAQARLPEHIADADHLKRQQQSMPSPLAPASAATHLRHLAIPDDITCRVRRLLVSKPLLHRCDFLKPISDLPAEPDPPLRVKIISEPCRDKIRRTFSSVDSQLGAWLAFYIKELDNNVGTSVYFIIAVSFPRRIRKRQLSGTDVWSFPILSCQQPSLSDSATQASHYEYIWLW